jgi:DNA-binding NtrC family response regulator
VQNPCHILLVEDDADQRALFTLALMSTGYQVVGSIDAEEALARMQGNSFALLLTDWYLPGMMGDELVQVVKREYPDVITVLMSSHTHVRDIAHASGADGWFRKNDGVMRLRALVNACMEHKHAVEE